MTHPIPTKAIEAAAFAAFANNPYLVTAGINKAALPEIWLRLDKLDKDTWCALAKAALAAALEAGLCEHESRKDEQAK